jgi:hypothetical protein
MSDIGRISPAVQWIAATGSMTIPVGVKGIFVKGAGSITVTDIDGTALTLAPTVDTVFPIKPTGVTSATNAFLLS